MREYKEKLLETLTKHQTIGITRQLDYEKFSRLSLIAHSAAMEGSSLSETECLLLLEDGIPAKGKKEKEQMISKDLLNAYNFILPLAIKHTDLTVDLLVKTAELVMQHTGGPLEGERGTFDTSKGELRTINVTAGVGGRSYPNYTLVTPAIEDLCSEVNNRRRELLDTNDVYNKYLLSFDICFLIESIHPWGEGNGRMARILMNAIQYEFMLPPNKILREDKVEYLESWSNAKDNNNIEIFEKFLIKEHIKNLQQEIDKYLIDNSLNPINSFVDLSDPQGDLQEKALNDLQETQFGPQENINEPQEILRGPQEKYLGPQGGLGCEPQESALETQILRAIAQNNKITREELAEITATSVSTIKRRLKKLNDQVVFIGSGYSGHWEIKNRH